MKVYAIKNGKNFYWFGEDAFFNIYDGSFAPFDKRVIMFDTEDLAEEAINRNELYGCTVVPITIFEGDPLKLACEKISSWEMNMSKDKMKDHFIQQAKESEKDE